MPLLQANKYCAGDLFDMLQNNSVTNQIIKKRLNAFTYLFVFPMHRIIGVLDPIVPLPKVVPLPQVVVPPLV